MNELSDTSDMIKNINKRVIFFDGVCNLCNFFVNLIIRFDKNNKFYFAPLQGETAKSFGLNFQGLKEEQQTIYYLTLKNKVYTRSDALLEVLQELFGFGFLFKVIKIVPQGVRDQLYMLIAKHRYRFFGQQTTCRFPSKQETKKFLP